MSEAMKRYEGDDEQFERPVAWTPTEDRRRVDRDDETLQFFPFLHQGEEFGLGFEACEVWVAMQGRVRAIEGNFSERNKGELLRFAQHFGYRCVCWHLQDGGLAFARFEVVTVRDNPDNQRRV